MPTPPGGQLSTGADPWELQYLSLPPLLEVGEGQRWVIAEYLHQESGTIYPCWLKVQSLPLGDFVLSLVWYGMLLMTFTIGAVAYWHRPLDRAARLFFLMCIVTLGSFVGGYHWWVLAGSLWLSTPYIACAVFVPVLTLHFLLVFPRPKRPVTQRPSLLFGLIYSVPAISLCMILGLLVSVHWASGEAAGEEGLARQIQVLSELRQWITGYFVVFMVYFLVTLGVVHNSYVGTRNSLERNQLRWIWRAGLVAFLCLVPALHFAVTDRTEFALGAGRLSVFLSSLSFMLAYSAGLIRFRLMLVEQIVSKGALYYVVTYGLTAAISLTIALGTLMPGLMNISLSAQQSASAAAVVVLSVVLLLWLRDRIQQTIDRKFFREKYQLDKALRRMNRAVSQIAEPEALAEMMLGQCRDVLRVDRAALYLRNGVDGPFQLVSAYGIEDITMQVDGVDQLEEALRESGCLQRVTSGTRGEMSTVQQLLHELDADLIHAIDVDEGICGLVMLGAKKNGGGFTAEDLTFLNALGQITNVALHSAKVDQEIISLNEELRLKVDKITEQQRQLALLRTELTSQGSTPGALAKVPKLTEFRRDVIIGGSPAIGRVMSTVRKVASSESSVLIRGESGTGKELLAQVLHENSSRGNGPLVSVHCASLSPSLLESELFGHAKGSFTGAHRDKVGRFEMASGGTLFLDEIGDISLETQVKLLRVLQERNFEPVGGTRTIHVDVRLVTATHQDLEKLIADGRFREDLYYRLNVISITLPSLRERMEDVFELALHFLNRSTKRAGKQITGISEEVLIALERHDWPGNIRELENAIERAVVLAEGDQITLDDLPEEFRVAAGVTDTLRSLETIPPASAREKPSRAQTPRIAEFDATQSRPAAETLSEKDLLQRTLRECGGNKAQAAKKLGMPRSTYYSKLQKYAIR
jgi:transcriptional regulator with GAF, ATPase, and Fis domain